MYPETGEILSRYDFERFLHGGFRAFFADLLRFENGNATTIERVDIEKLLVGRITVHAERGYIFVTNIRFQSINVRECVRSVAGRQREIQAGRGVEAVPFGIAPISKIVVAIDKTQAVSPATTQGERTPKQDAAITADDEREHSLLQERADFRR